MLMPLLLTVSCFNKIQIGFTFLVLAHRRAVKRVCVCVCVCVYSTVVSHVEIIIGIGSYNKPRCLPGRLFVVRLELEAALVEETSASALNASEESHELAKQAVDSASQVTDEIWLLQQRYDTYHYYK